MKLKNRIIAIILIACTLILPFGSIAASAKSITELEGTELNGATVLTEENKYLTTKAYTTPHDNGFNVSKGTSNGVLPKSFASFYIDTLGEGGSVLKGANGYMGYDAYGFIAGSGEEFYQKHPETGEDVLMGHNSVAVKLKYNYSSLENLKDSSGRSWDISDDTWQGSINGMDSVGLVGKGAVIVQKFVPSEGKESPTSSGDWKRLNQFSGKETDGLHTVNFFEVFSPSKHKDPFVVYTPSGEDLQKGVFVKLTVAYELVTLEKSSFLFFDTSKNVYKDVVEETVFYLCNTSAEVVFNNLYFESSTGDQTPDQDQTTPDASTTEATKKGGPVSNNQGAIDGFNIQTNGWNYDISYHYNGSSNALKCYDGQVFIEPGRYDFVIKTKIGVVRTKTIYIHEKTKERNVEVYFGNSLFSDSSLRAFLPAEEYPVFVKDGLTLKTENENSGRVKHAPLVGRVYLVEGEWATPEGEEPSPRTLVATKEKDDFNWSLSNLKEGKYEAIFANNEEYFDGTATGDTYVFTWRFSVIEKGYAPAVNEELLYQHLGFSDYESLHYVAALPTKGEGRVLVVFSDRLSAYDYACKYLASTVNDENGYLFDGVMHRTEAEMLVALREKANTMVLKRYYDATDATTYLTLKDDILNPVIDESSSESEKEYYESFVKILDREFEHDILVFVTEDGMENAAVGEPFLNNRVIAYIDEDGNIQTKEVPLKFISVADYESQRVTMYLDGTDLCYKVPYGVGLEGFLRSKNAPTGLYRIVEENPNGETEYYGVYIRKGDITTSMSLEVLYNGNTVVYELGRKNLQIQSIRANSFRIASIFNDLDPYGIVKIKKDNSDYLIYQINEYEEIPDFSEEGSYEIVLVDRLGNSASFKVDIFDSQKFYNLTLKDKDKIILSENAYLGKEFKLPSLETSNKKLEFAGWIDENGVIYKDSYVFESKGNVVLEALWYYSSVSISVYDGSDKTEYEAKVSLTQELPQLTKDGYTLYGFRYILDDGTIRIYRGQITSVPNVESMRLDALWIKNESITSQLEKGEGEEIKVTLVDGDVHSVLTVNKSQLSSLPQLENQNGMVFGGWLYEYRLSGVIFDTEFSFNDIEQIGYEDKSSLKLNALWLSEEKSTVPVAVPFGGTTNGSSISGTPTAVKDKGISTSNIVAIIGSSLLFVLLALCFAFRHKLCLVASCIKNRVKAMPVKRNALLLADGTCIESEDDWDEYGGIHLNTKKKIKKLFVALISFILVLSTIFCAGYEVIALAPAEISSAIEVLKEEKKAEERAEKIEATLELLNDSSSNITEDEEYNQSIEFLTANIMVDLYALGYTDVFTAYAITGQSTESTEDDKVIEGIGYTSYVDAYKENGEYIFGAGFISLPDGDVITQEDKENGVLIQIDEDEASYYDYTEFKLTFNQSIQNSHYVAYNKYVTYFVSDYLAYYTLSEDSGEYIDAYGDVYNYDIGEYCHFVNYGEYFDLDAFGISDDMDYDELVETFRGAMEVQMQNGLEVNVEKADFISIQSINDYIAHNQDERFLNVDEETLLFYEANLADTQYYIVYEDGTVGVLDLPPDPSNFASIWERIAGAIIGVVGAVVGVVACCIPGAGPIIGGALISASLDIFMQVTVFNTPFDKVDWVSVGISALTGAVTGGIGAAGNAAANAAVKAAAMGVKSAAKKFFIKLGVNLAVEVGAGMFSGAATYLITSQIRGEEFDLAECMKQVGLGAATGAIIAVGSTAVSAIGSKINNKALLDKLKSVMTVVGGAFSGMVSYSLACAILGQEFTWQGFAMASAMGAATGALMLVGNKLAKTVQTAKAKRAENAKNKIVKKNDYSNEQLQKLADMKGISLEELNQMDNAQFKDYVESIRSDGVKIAKDQELEFLKLQAEYFEQYGTLPPDIDGNIPENWGSAQNISQKDAQWIIDNDRFPSYSNKDGFQYDGHHIESVANSLEKGSVSKIIDPDNIIIGDRNKEHFNKWHNKNWKTRTESVINGSGKKIHSIDRKAMIDHLNGLFGK